MGGISTGVGIFSGINSAQLIEQLLAIEARPKAQAQARLGQFQLQQAAYLDINARLTAVRTAAAAFRESKTFQTKSATSSNDAVLKAVAGTDAAPGTHQFIVDRLVSTQSQLSRGFANRDVSSLGMTSISFESAQARLDRDVELADLNNGSGVARGRIVVTDSGGRSATIDLSRATTVSEVLEAINTNGTAQITASVSGGRFVVRDNAAGNLSIADAQGSTTATSLGLAGIAASGGAVTGNSVYGLSGSTTLASLNDGLGVSGKPSTTEDSYSFIINVGGAAPATVRVNLGDVWETVGGALTKVRGAVSDVGGVVTRINEALAAAGTTGISASIDSTNGRLVIDDSTGTQPLTITEGTDTTAADLGLMTSPVSGDIVGRRILSGMQATMLRGLKGGAMPAHDGALAFTLRNGASFNVTLDTGGSIQDALKAIEDASVSGGTKRLSATLDARGTGIVLTDLTGGGGNLIITGTNGADAAAALGISTGAGGIASATAASGNLQRQYIGRSSTLASLNSGRGIGTGELRITDSYGTSASVNITDSIKTVGELIDLVNSRGLRVSARINPNGDGIQIVEHLGTGEAEGAQRIKIEEVGSGGVARALNLLGEASGTGSSNTINGSFERVVTLAATDTLQQITDKINAARAGMTASIVRDGGGSNPFRLSLASVQSGRTGRVIVDSGSFDLGLTTLDAGRDARVFFGSADAATGVAVTASTNTIDNILTGVKIDLKGVSASTVTLTIATDTAGIEKAVSTFISAFNTAVTRIESQTRYDKDNNRKSPLLGDATALELRAALYSTAQGSATGLSGPYQQLADVGITVGSGGTLQFNADRFRAALAEDPAAVEALFAARTASNDSTITLSDGITVRNPNAGSTFSTLGVMGRLEQLVKKYIEGSDGVLNSRGEQLRGQITSQQSRITSIDDRLSRRRDILQRQFAAMERAIGQMQTQQASLGSIRSIG